MRLERVIVAPGVGIFSWTLPPTGQAIRIIGVMGSLAIDATAQERNIIVSRAINGADVTEFHSSPIFGLNQVAPTTVPFVAKPGLVPAIAENPGVTQVFVSIPLPEFGIVQDIGDVIEIALLNATAGDQLAAIAVEYLTEKVARA